MKLALALVALVSLGASSVSRSQELNGSLPNAIREQSTDRFIVKWRSALAEASSNARTQKLSLQTGISLQRKHSITDRLEVLQMERALDGAALSAALAQLQSDSQVEYAAPDLRRHLHAIPSDPLFAEQWYLQSTQPSSTRSDQAWDVTVSDASTVVAVLDTGVRFEHPDLGRVEEGGKVLAGYDFISRARVANDGDGWDSDASDPGDWIDAADRQQPEFDKCEIEASSWHGTRVAGMVGARTDNAVGVAGNAWNTLILPVRVMGKCGGFDSDIIAGMRWAAGLGVSGAPLNPTPAKIVNVSLGGDGACTMAYQATINELSANGVLVVASVGNEGGTVSSPANCNGALGVSGLRHVGTKVGFSNLGPATGLAAPGGNCVTSTPSNGCLFSLVVPTNSGANSPGISTYSDAFNYNVGTSFSAPLVASAAALMRSVNARLGPGELIALLKESATPFPVDPAEPFCRVPTSSSDLQKNPCNCTTETCGAGMLNTHAAVLAAQRPFAIAQAPSLVESGSIVSIDARNSIAADARHIVSYQWSVSDVSGATPAIIDATQAITSLQVSGESRFTLRLTVIDDLGTQDTADVSMATSIVPAPSITPSGAMPGGGGNGGGGGGQIGWELLTLPFAWQLRRRRAAKH